MRPEQTASVVRAFVEHKPVLPWKVWYAGPNFRYEKAQKGRYRQFDQVGVEVLGPLDPYADVEVIALAWRFYERLGLRRVALLLNSLGDAGDRGRYADALEQHFRRQPRRAQRGIGRDARPQPAAGARLQAPPGRARSSRRRR